MAPSLLDDPLLAGVPEHEGYKVLAPAVLVVKIGQGGMGAVYRGRHLTFDVDVAVKCLKPALAADDARFVERFGREAKLAAEISHENLVRVYHVDREARSNLHYLVMEFVEGETARDRVQRKGPLSEPEAAKILLGAARGLARAHRHERAIVHRDVKPENILISRRGEVKIADLGIAKAEEGAGTLTSSNVAIGTPLYMAPEQWDDAHKVGPPADVWSLGATLYFLLTGENAIRSGTLQHICREICDKPFPDARRKRPKLGDELMTILTRCVARDPAERYPDAGALAEELERYVAAHQTTLLDAESGRVRAEALVSPPPTAALQRIRARLQVTSVPPTPPEATKTFEKAPPKLARGPAPKKNPFLWPIVAGLIALVAFGLWWMLRERDPAHEPRPAEQEAERADSGAPRPGPSTVSPAALTPILSLDQDLGRERRLDTREMTVKLTGRVENVDPAAGGVLRVTRNGKRSGDYALEADGRFELELGLKRNQREALELAHGPGTLAFEVVQDSEEPVLSIVEPAEARRRTNQDSFDLAVKVTEANLANVALGGRALAPGPDDTWVAASVGLAREGENPFAITARDRAGTERKLDLSVWRDTQGPERESAEPADGAEVEGGMPLTLVVTFDEPPASATLAGSKGIREGDRARFELDVPPGEGRFEWKGEARDALGNSATFSWAGTRPTKPKVRVPDGWEVVDATSGFGGWAKKVREPKSGIELILVEPGTFQMGSPANEEGRDDDETQHHVELTKAFYLGETEVTVGHWKRYASESGYVTEAERGEGGYTVVSDGSWQEVSWVDWANPLPAFMYDWDDRHPVTLVSWNDARSFCRHFGFVLPTEAQWEYACRAGTKTRFSWGDDEDGCKGRGNFADVSAKNRISVWATSSFDDGHAFTAPVGSYSANAWGFRDMSGNVWEWCGDGYRADYQSLSAKDPFQQDAELRVLRGGSWSFMPRDCRAADRYSFGPSARYSGGGFRVARIIP
jgi:formylglycine-generating enzyme required for sulfatase activity/serine/threonine protein kinase